MAPLREVEVLKATLRIEAEESYQPQTSTGKSKGWERMVLRETASQPIGRTLQPGSSEELVLEISVPSTAPTTLNAHPYYVEWRAITTIEIASWPDLVDTQTIAVIP